MCSYGLFVEKRKTRSQEFPNSRVSEALCFSESSFLCERGCGFGSGFALLGTGGEERAFSKCGKRPTAFLRFAPLSDFVCLRSLRSFLLSELWIGGAGDGEQRQFRFPNMSLGAAQFLFARVYPTQARLSFPGESFRSSLGQSPHGSCVLVKRFLSLFVFAFALPQAYTYVVGVAKMRSTYVRFLCLSLRRSLAAKCGGGLFLRLPKGRGKRVCRCVCL